MRITRTWRKWLIIGLGAALALAPTLTAFAGSFGGGGGAGGSYP